MVASWAGLNIQERARDKTEENFFLVSQAAIDMNSGLTLEGGVALVTGAAKRLGGSVNRCVKGLGGFPRRLHSRGHSDSVLESFCVVDLFHQVWCVECSP